VGEYAPEVYVMKCAYCEEEITGPTFSCPTCKGKLHRDCLNPHIDYWADDPEEHAELREVNDNAL
jgi:hypothetical protein